MLKTAWSIIKRFLLGGMMGIVALIPGVSSGSIAVMTGIYADIIHAMKSIFQRRVKKRKHILFLVNLLSGMLAAALLFAQLMNYLLTVFPNQMMIFIIGLIMGTTPFLYRKAMGSAFKPLRLIPMAVCFLLVVILGLASPRETSFVFMLTWSSVVMVFLAGFISSGVGLIPGISGSMVLMLIGMYSTLIASIQNFYMPFLLVFAFGVFAGLAVFSQGIHYLLQKHEPLTYSAIFGLFLGSAVNIQLELPAGWIDWLTSGVILLAGAGLALISLKRGRKIHA